MAIKFFKVYDYYHGAGGKPTTSHYTAVGESDDSNTRPSAKVTLQHGYREEVKPGEDPSELWENWRKDSGEQQVLFHEQPSTITLASADNSLRGTPAMTLLGMAVADANKLGHGLTYDDSLSSHSSKIAREGISAGVVRRNPSNPNAINTNNMAGTGAHRHTQRVPSFYGEKYSPLGSEVSPEEMQAGRNVVRDFINKRRARKLGAQFDEHVEKAPEQLHLSPELEAAYHNPTPAKLTKTPEEEAALAEERKRIRNSPFW